MASKVVIPAVEVYARPFGYLQWVCPNCHEIHGAEQISGRSGRIGCGACKRVFRLGFAFGQGATLIPPFNAKLNGDWNGYTVNSLGDLFPANAMGRFRGRMDWACPRCNRGNSSSVGVVLMDLSCAGCDAKYFLGVIFHASKSGVHLKCPLDWSIPNETPRDTLHPLVVEAAGQSA